MYIYYKYLLNINYALIKNYIIEKNKNNTKTKVIKYK